MIFAKGRLRFWPLWLGVAAAAAVAVPPVEEAVGAELQLPAVVVGREVLDEEELLLRTTAIAVGPVRAVLHDVRVAVAVGVVDVEAVRRRVGRVEGHREQALLAAALDHGADVEERRGRTFPFWSTTNPAGLLDDVEVARLALHRRRVHGALELADLHQTSPCPAGRSPRGGRPRREHDGDGERGHDETRHAIRRRRRRFTPTWYEVAATCPRGGSLSFRFAFRLRRPC